MVYSDPNNTNSIAYQDTLLSYWLKTSNWNISWAVTLHLYNMADRGEKLQEPHCYHPFSDSRDTYLTKNHYENYSPKMVPTNPTGSWTTFVMIFLILTMIRSLSILKYSEYICFHSKINFAKLSNLMPCINNQCLSARVCLTYLSIFFRVAQPLNI